MDLPKRGEWPCQTKPDPARELSPKLVAFLYRLMRNDLPTGVVEQHLIEVGGQFDDIEYTNPHLEALARAHAAYLLR